MAFHSPSELPHDPPLSRSQATLGWPTEVPTPRGFDGDHPQGAQDSGGGRGGAGAVYSEVGRTCYFFSSSLRKMVIVT